MIIVEIADDRDSLQLLGDFHSGVFSREFPDEDERELLENMEAYLSLKAAGWYGSNNYHILLLVADDGLVCGGLVADYFERSNAGVIEFMVVDTALRGQGWGTKLLEEISRQLHDDALRAGHTNLNGICGEVNDPYRRCDVREHLDGFERMRMWDHFGFRLLDFPYVQPPLSEHQNAVTGLGLMFQPARDGLSSQVPAILVEQLVADYQIWAMRIADPESQLEFRHMKTWLRRHDNVKLLNMRDYVCEEKNPPFEVVEIHAGDDSLFDQFADAYTAAFANEQTCVDVSEFRRGTRTSTNPIPHCYWLWGVRIPGDPRMNGLASFFSFPHCGFVGYAALSGPVQSKGKIKRLLRMIERRIVEENPAASGWYGECEPDERAASLASRLGMFQIPMIYRQPRLPTDKTGKSEGKILRLFYKPFGRVYEPPVLSLENLQRDLREIMARIYNLDEDGVEQAMSTMTWPEKSAENVLA